jgi:outer membrane lipoprotein-sorting protein
MSTRSCAWTAGAVLILMLIPLHARCAEWGIDQLMHSLAQIRSERATFTEIKYLAILERPLESSGELLYAAPGRLEKRTLKPKPEAMILEHNVLVLERGRQKHRLQLQEHPELAAFIDSIRGTLAGDRQALERNYRLSLEGSAEHWTLQLQPLNDKMLAAVKQVRMAGARDAVRSIEITHADGDRSLMQIERVVKP